MSCFTVEDGNEERKDRRGDIYARLPRISVPVSTSSFHGKRDVTEERRYEATSTDRGFHMLVKSNFPRTPRNVIIASLIRLPSQRHLPGTRKDSISYQRHILLRVVPRTRDCDELGAVFGF